MEGHKESNNQLAKLPNKQEVVNFNNYSNMEEMLKFVEPLVKSGVFPQKSAGEAAAVMLWAKDKKINLIDAMAHTVVVNNKVTVDSHLSRALLQNAGIFCNFATASNGKFEDYRALYAWRYKDEVFTQDDIDEFPENFQKFINKTAFDKAYQEGSIDKAKIPVIRSTKPVDIRTSLIFTRIEEGKTLVDFGTFTWSEAVKAQLTIKDNWISYPQDCLYARAYMRGARRIAADKVFGIYTKDEMNEPEVLITPEYTIED